MGLKNEIIFMVDQEVSKYVQILGLPFYQSTEYTSSFCLSPIVLRSPFSPNYLFFGPIKHKDLKLEKAQITKFFAVEPPTIKYFF